GHPPPPPPAAPESDPLELLSDPLVLGGAGVIVLFAVVLLLRRRAGRAPAAAAEDAAETAAAPAAQAAPVAAVTAATVAAAEQESGDFEAAEGAPAGGGDPLGEADVYMAYGRFPQAEELLRNALNAEPQRADFMLKLLEIYQANKDRASFERQFEHLHEVVAGEASPLWDRAVEMARSVTPGHHLLAAAGAAAAAAAGTAAAAAADMASAAEIEAMPEVSDEDELDIDLDFEPLFGDEGEDDGQPLDITQEFEGDSLAEALSEGEDEAEQADEAGDFDLDLGESTDFDLGAAGDETMVQAVGEETMVQPVAEPEAEAEEEELDLGALAETETGTEPEAADEESGLGDLNLEFEVDEATTELGSEFTADELEDLDLGFEEEAEPEQAVEEAADEQAEDATLQLGDGLDEGVDLEFDEQDLADFDLGEESSFEGGDNEEAVNTKLELAQAYLDMEDVEGARSILEEVLEDGSDAQKAQAQELLGRCS
ncbi:MAG TPA: FimV/HubP family polar landmark protein, partial [Gammaproteobacteria bacterium]